MSQAAATIATGLSARAAELRRAFDSAFAEPAHTDAAVTHELLAIEAGGQAYAIRLSEMTGLFAGKKITRVPGSAAGVLGVAGFRGALVPVYDLGAVLGEAGAGDTPRWLLIAQAAPIAFAFDALRAQLRVRQDDIAPHAASARAQCYAPEVVRTEGFMGPLLHLSLLLETIKATGQSASPHANRNGAIET